MSGIIIQIWLTFLLNIIKDIIWQFIVNNEKFRKAWFWFKRHYLLLRLPYGTFLKHYKNFIKEKNEIFSLIMADYQKNLPKDPIFFFSALTKYWFLKKTLIKQYEKILNIHLVDDKYDIFEDEIKQAKSLKTRDSLKQLIWKIKIVDPDFKKEFDKSVDNLRFLKSLINKDRLDKETLYIYNSRDFASIDDKRAFQILRSYIFDVKKLLSQWDARHNKIRNIEKFELYAETKIIQKYVKELDIKVEHKDSVNMLRLINIINNFLEDTAKNIKKNAEGEGFWNSQAFIEKKYYKRFINSQKIYVKSYYRLLIKKYLLLEFKKPIKELSPSDAVLIIKDSANYLNIRNKIFEDFRNKDLSMNEKWKIAYRLWELNEIRKNICLTYLEIDTDFSKWATQYEKLTSLAKSSDISIANEVKDSEEFLKSNINPTEVFSIEEA